MSTLEGIEKAKNINKSRNIRKTTALVTSHFINDVYPHLYPGLLPVVLMPQLGFSITAAGLISTVSALTTQLLQPFLGYWADRLGGKMFVVGGLLLASLFVPFTLAWAPTYILLLVGLLIGGIGNAAFHPHASALMSEFIGKYKGSGMSIFMVAGNFGRLAAPVLASSALYFGGRHGLAALAVPGLILAIVMFFSMNPAPAPKKTEDKVLSKEFFGTIKEKGGFSLLVVVGIRYMMVMSIVTLVPIMWAGRGIDYSIYNLLLTVVFAAGMVGNIIGGTFSDFVGHKPVIIASAVLSAFTLLLFVNSDSILVGFVFMALVGACLYSADPVVMVFSHRLFPDNKGMASGIIGLGGMVGSLGVTFTGFIADIFTPAVGLYVAAAMMIVSIPFIYRLKK